MSYIVSRLYALVTFQKDFQKHSKKKQIVFNLPETDLEGFLFCSLKAYCNAALIGFFGGLGKFNSSAIVSFLANVRLSEILQLQKVHN